MARFHWSTVLVTVAVLGISGCPKGGDGTSAPDAVIDTSTSDPDTETPDSATPSDTTTEPDTPVTPDAQEPDVPVGPEPDATPDAGDATTDTGEDTGPPPECETEAECQHLAAPCVLGICVDGACTTSPDTCDDGDSCTEDSCDLEAGCHNVYGALTCEGAAVAYTTTVDDAANILGGAAVEGTGDVVSSDLNTGEVTLTNTAGSYVWTFSAEGYLPVWRSATLAQGEVLTVPTPWLHPRNSASHLAVPGEEATATSQDLSVSVTVGADSVAEETTATVTALDGQTLPAELPRGWSPIQGFWLEMSAEPAEALQVTANPWFEVSGQVVLVTLDAEGGYWVISTTFEVSEGDALDFEVWGAGAYAVVVADADPQGPEAGLEGEILTGVEATDPENDGFSAEGSLLPVISAVSSDPEAVTARALIELSHETAGAMSSGYPLHGTTTQTYWLQDGSTVALPTSPYELVSYQRPDDDSTTLHADFSVRPGLLFDHSDLLEASNVLSIWSGEAPTVDVLDGKGGSASSEAVSVTVPEGALAGTSAIAVTDLDPTTFDPMTGESGEVVLAFHLTVGETTGAAALGADFGTLTPETDYLLARVLTIGTRAGLEPMERLTTNEDGVADSAEPADGSGLPGLQGAGTYVLMTLTEPVAVISGTVEQGDGTAATGVPVWVLSTPWLDRSTETGAFHLIGAPGDHEVSAADEATGHEAWESVTLESVDESVSLTLTLGEAGPRVLTISPEDEADDADPVSPIVLGFSEALDPATVSDASIVIAVGDTEETVEGSISVNAAGDTLTMLPTNPMDYETLHTLSVSGAITDLDGTPLEGQTTFTFTTRPAPTKSGEAAQLIIYEPGAETHDCDGVAGFDPTDPSVICIVGTHGSADPFAPVILLNETSGGLTTVTSEADGSFKSFLVASADDFISANFVNSNDTSVYIPVSRQLYDDGRVGLYSSGGEIEALMPEGDGSPPKVLFAPGSIEDKVVLKLEMVDLELFQEMMTEAAPDPDQGTALGALKMSFEGDAELVESADLVFPVNEGTLDLSADTAPEDFTYALTVRRENDGVIGYEIIDHLHYENGSLVTHSFPFLGIMFGMQLVGGSLMEYSVDAILMAPLKMASQTGPTIVSGTVYACYLAEPVGENPADCEVDGAGEPITRPLAGAMVLGYSPGKDPPDPTWPIKGSVYSMSGGDGKYSMLSDLSTKHLALYAIHSAYPDLSSGFISQTHAPLISGVYIHDFIFKIDLGSMAGDNPPGLQLSHSPFFPSAEDGADPAELKVLAIHGGGPPTVNVTVESVTSLVAGVEASIDDVSVTGPTETETLGVTGARTTWEVSATKSVSVELEVSATGGGLESQAGYKIEFGGSPSEGDNTLEAADPLDDKGPYVLYSEPEDDGFGPPAGGRIALNFNEPIDTAILLDGDYLALNPDAGEPVLTLSPDQRTLEVLYPGLLPAQSYTLTVPSVVRDLNGNHLDQDPLTTAEDSFVLTFETPPLVKSELGELDTGTGGVIVGQYAFVLEQKGPLNGALYVYDVGNPGSPVKVGELSVPGMPWDLTFIPDYSFIPAKDEEAVTKNLIAIVGGPVGAFQQYMWVVDISDPTAPTRLAGKLITPSSTAAVTQVKWSAPHLAMLQIDGDQNIVVIADLQEYIYSESLTEDDVTATDYPAAGQTGLDLNGDGDYVDEGEELPLPPKDYFLFHGWVRSHMLHDTNQAILDYHYDASRQFLGVVTTGGKQFLPGTGLATGPAVQPSYRTLVYQGLEGEALLPFESTNHPLGEGVIPKRMFVYMGAVVGQGETLSVRDLVFVGLKGYGDTPARLLALDITDPLSVQTLADITIDPSHGSVQSILVDDAGMVRVQATHDLIMIDPSKLDAEVEDDESHPAIAGVLPGAGTGQYTFTAAGHGMSVVAHASKTYITQTAPTLQFVRFPESVDVVDPTTLAGDSDALTSAKDLMSTVASLVPARYEEVDDVAVSSLSPPNPLNHYHVLVHAPGGAGETLDLALESLDRVRAPISPKGFRFAPTRAMSDTVHSALGAATDDCVAPVRSLKAWRLSSDPTSEDYNRYLSRPFALTYEALSREQLEALQDSLDRDILWSGHFTRVSIDPTMEDNDTLGPYAAHIDTDRGVIKPVVSTTIRSYAADFIMGPNPGTRRSNVPVPGTNGAVTAHNGEMHVDVIDLTLPSRSLPITWRRVSSAQSLYDGPFGRGWDFPYNQRLVSLEGAVFPEGAKMPLVVTGGGEGKIASSNDVLFHDGRGHVVQFTYEGEEVPTEYASDPLLLELEWFDKAAAFYLPQSGVFEALVRFESGEFARLTREGRQYWYSSAGSLKTIYDRYPDNTLTFLYDARGRLSRIEDEAGQPGETYGRYLDVGYYVPSGDPLFRAGIDEVTSDMTEVGHVARIQDATGRDVLYEYTDGLLTRVEGIEITDAGPDGFTGRPITEYTWSTCEDGGASGQAIRAVIEDTGDGVPSFAASGVEGGSLERVSGGTGAFGAVALEFDHDNTAEALQGGAAETRVTLPSGSNTRMRFDDAGRLSEVTEGIGTEQERTTSYTYNDVGQVTSVTFGEGNSVHYTFDDENPNLRARANVLETTKEPGPRGGDVLTRTTSFDLRYNQPTGTQTNFNGDPVYHTLTTDGRSPSKVQIGSEPATTYTYNNFGQQLTSTTPDGVERANDYNLDGFVTTSSLGDEATNHSYDGASGRRGAPSQTTPPRGDPSYTTYDELNRMISRTRGARTESWSYDGQSNLIRQSHSGPESQMVRRQTWLSGVFLETTTLEGVEVDGSPVSLTTTRTPDAAMRLQSVELPSGALMSYAYNSMDQVESLTRGGASVHFGYDRNGNLVERAYGSADSGVAETTTYDGHDRAILSVDLAGSNFAREYDGEGRLTSLSVSDSHGVALQETYTMDGLGRVVARSRAGDNGTATHTVSYSQSGPQVITTTTPSGLIQVTQRATSGQFIGESVEALGLTRTYTHDSYERTITETYGGETTAYTLTSDGLEHLVGISDDLGSLWTFTPRTDGKVTAITNALGNTEVRAFTALGEVSEAQKPTGVSLTVGYTADRDPSYVLDTESFGASFSYDDTLRQVSNANRSGQETSYSDFTVTNHPQQVNIPGGQISQTYDGEGRVLSATVTAGTHVRAETYAYDALDRIRTASYPAGSATFDYDGIGPITKDIRTVGAHTYETTASYDLNGARTLLGYPSGVSVAETRDAAGRLISLSVDGETLIAETTFAGLDRVATQTYGSNLMTLTNTWDGRHRISQRQVTGASGERLMELRYAYDLQGNPVARQHVHLQGPADFFQYDAGDRLVRADMMANPTQDDMEGLSIDGFQVPDEVTGSWFSGRYARSVTYDAGGLDLVEAITSVNPWDAPLPPLAESYQAPDSALQIQQIDGFARGASDPRGNTTAAWLYHRFPGDETPNPSAATLTHSGRNHLVHLQAGSVDITYGYDHEDLLTHRQMTCPGGDLGCEPKETAYVWHGQRLLETWDLLANQVSARFYYTDNQDYPFAADLRQDDGNLERFFLLTDTLGSVVVVTDATGAPVERIHYDPWGQPTLEAADTTTPSISKVIAYEGALLVVFSEQVALPVTFGAGPAIENPSNDESISAVLTFATDGSPINGSGSFALSASEYLFGTVVRFEPSSPMDNGAEITIALQSGSLVDGWNNPVASASLQVTWAGDDAGELYSGTALGSTAAGTHAVSTIGNPFLWQGQYLDYDAGLYYLRARHYDPASALFLQPDPSGYVDSPNPYQVMGHNPLANRDPSGRKFISLTRSLDVVDVGWMSKANLGRIRNHRRLSKDAHRALIKNSGWPPKSWSLIGPNPSKGQKAWLEVEEKIFGNPPPGANSLLKEYINLEGIEGLSLTGLKDDIENRNKLKVEKHYQSGWVPKPARPWTGPRKRDATASANPSGRPSQNSRFVSGDVLRGAGQSLNTRPYLGPTSSPTPPGATPGRHGTPFADMFDFSHQGMLGELQTYLGELDGGSTLYLQRLEGAPIQGLTPDPITRDVKRLSKPWP